ncbi:MAG TPA: HWE histidine kinase domain-containing protein [Devosia sp.]|jgi:two-component sensor histidine kinase|uniref:sensor histidine kinase n=1 Tax=Devosia sp. TaxID=1871048 RepID=UPI002F9284B4
MKAPGLSLSQRLLLLTAVALLPSLAILGFNELSLRRTRIAEIHDYALRMSELASLEMERLLTGAGALMVAVASAPVELGPGSECATYLNHLTSALPQLTLIDITDIDGRSLCANRAAPGDLAPELSASVRAALAERFFAVGEYSELSAGPALLMGTRRTDDSGMITGYVIAAVGLDYLGGMLKERSFPQGSALTIADRNGVILAREPFPEDLVGTRVPEAFLPRVQGTESGTMQVVSQDGTERVLGYQPASKPLGLYVSAGTGVADAMATVNESSIRSLLLAGVGGLLALLLALSFGRRFIRLPVLRLLQTIKAWRQGDQTARTGMQPGPAEFHQVGHAIDELLDELEQRQAAQQEAEQHRDLLARELDHRIKNLLATVQAVARQSFRNANLPRDALDAFYGRLSVMADAHKLLTAQKSESASVEAVVRTAVTPFYGVEQQRFSLAGPEVELHAKAALSLAMALHELCTNASKYGALTSEGGRVDIGWALTEGHKLILTWRESGGPAVTPPSEKGFGSRMIERALAADLGATVSFDFAPTGLTCTIIAAETALLGRQVTGAGPFQPVPAVLDRS